MVDVGKALELLDKYNLRSEAERECKRRKIDSAPYDMIGHNKVYCELLNREWIKLRNQVVLLQKEKCKLWDGLAEEIKPLHERCDFARFSLSKKGICEKCDYNEQLVELEVEMKALNDGQKALDDASKRDYYLK